MPITAGCSRASSFCRRWAACAIPSRIFPPPRRKRRRRLRPPLCRRTARADDMVKGASDTARGAETPAETPDGTAHPGAARQADSFLESLVFLTSYFGHARSAEALAAGLPVEKTGMTPKLFCEAAQRAGFRAQVVRRRPSQVPSEVMPAVVVLKSKEAVLLVQRGKGQVKLMDPATRSETVVSAKELEKKAAGYVIYARPQEEEEDAPLSRHWFWSDVLENLGIYARVLLASFLINCFALTSPIFIMNFYNRVLPNNAQETGWVLAIGAGSIYIFDFVIRTLRSYFIDIAGRRADVIVGQRLYDQVLDMKLGQRRDSVGVMANSMREFDSLREFFNSATMTGLVDFPFSFLFIAAIWMIAGGTIAALLLGFYLLVLVTGYLMQLPVRRKVRLAMRTAEQKHGLLIETLGNLETIRGVGGEGALRAAYSHYVGRAAEAGQDSRFYSGLSVNFSLLIQQLSVIVIVLVGMYLIAGRELSVGALMACVILSYRAIAPIGQVAGLISRYYQARSAYRTLDAVMKLPVERPRGVKFLHRPALKGAFSFRNVEFSYPRTFRPVLQGVNLNIVPGEKIAVVGRIGSGKSTLVKLMVNFFEPSQGTVLVDETDMRQIDPADLRRNIAYMGQDTTLMSGTVRENIVMGRPRATDEEVLRVAELAGVHDFIRHKPMGYDTPVGERGEGLSGGQRQAVALARTLLMDTPVLIMDEPTNSMDSTTEARVLQNIAADTQERTVIIVTHKPALLQLVTRVIVMDNGRMVLDGPRDEVLAALSSGKVAVPQA
ncbi:MAG: type I secretion system permease/ATPase [Alphaproteobacteria bacterium]|nr:type I secretion system permease/ATPase [Alphaproteobacteria bacterium]